MSPLREYEVVWSESAEKDLEEIVKYIAIESPKTARRVLKNIKKHVDDLYFYPEKFRIVPELYKQGITQYREVIVAPWRALYRVSDKKVVILALFDSRQNIEDVLLSRLI